MPITSFGRSMRREQRVPGASAARRNAGILLVLLLVGAALALALVPMAGSQARPAWPRVGDGGRYPAEIAEQLPQYWLSEGRPGVAPSDVMTNNWTNLFPALSGVSVVSPEEAWAVGDFGRLLHYTGTNWTVVDPPSMNGLDLSSIDMLSPSSGWIASGRKAFQYDGAAWNERSSGLGSLLVQRIGAVASQDVWGIGTLCDGSSCRASVAHWDGAAWSPAGPVLTPTVRLYDIAIAGASDGWIVGDDFVDGKLQAVLLRFNGTAWARVDAPLDSASLATVWAETAGEAWVAGFSNGTVPYAYRFSGGAWSEYFTDGFIGKLFMLSPNEGWATAANTILRWNGAQWLTDLTGKFMQGLAGTGTQVWAVGWADTVLSRTTSGVWTPQRGGPTTYWLTSVSVVDANSAWAVGLRGNVIRYANGAWQSVPSTFITSFNDVSAVSADESFLVGNYIIVRCTPAGCAQVASSSTVMYGVHMQSNGEGWAVGEMGTIWHRPPGGSWAQASSPVTRTLYTVAMDSPTHGWAAGGDYGGTGGPAPVLVEYTGGAWVDRSAGLPPGSPVIHDLVLAPGGQGLAVGGTDWAGADEGAILRLSGGTWTLDTTAIGLAHSVQFDAGGEAWAAGCVGYHYSGGSWQQKDLPTRRCGDYPYYGYKLGLVPGQGGWAVGMFGSIFRYDPPGVSTPTPTRTAAATHTATPQPSATATPTLRPMTFSDVQPSDYFYEAVRYLYGRGVISGYADNTFRPYNTTTRGQLCKIVVLAEGWPALDPQNPTFVDVPRDNPFYTFIETAYNREIISGYGCGAGCLEFRPYNNVTRGQLCKIIVLARGWEIDTTGGPHFTDVPLTDPFYGPIETAYNREIISGYGCGAGCLEFRPGSSATRGQICKIVYNAINSP